MLSDLPDDEFTERSRTRSAIAAPSGPFVRRDSRHVDTETENESAAWSGCGRQHRQSVRDSAHHEIGRKVGKPVQVLQDQAELPHQGRVLEILRQRWLGLGHKNRVVLRQGRDELGIDRQVFILTMAGAASSAVAVESLVEEAVSSSGDQVINALLRASLFITRRRSIVSL